MVVVRRLNNKNKVELCYLEKNVVELMLFGKLNKKLERDLELEK